MDETREGIEVQQEIDSLLSGGLSQQDEDDVMAELDEILAEGQRDNVNLPDVPVDEVGDRERVPAKKRREDVQEQREAVAAT